MISTLRLIPNMLKFIFSFRSIQVLTFFSILFLLVAIFGVSKVSGFGGGAVLNILGQEINFVFVSMAFNSIYLVVMMGVLLITIQISEFLFFGHFAQSIISKFRKRYPILVAYLIASISVALLAAVLYSSHYYPVSPSLNHYLYNLLYNTLFFYTVILGTTIVVNYSSLKKYTILVMIFIFYMVPLTLNFVLPMFSGQGFLYASSRAFLSGISKLTSIHIEVSNQASNIIKTGLILDGLFLETIALFGVYVLIIGYQFMKKDFS